MVAPTDVCDTSKALGVFGEMATFGLALGVGYLAHKTVQTYLRGALSPEAELLVGPACAAITVISKHIISDHVVLTTKTVEHTDGGRGTPKKVKGVAIDKKDEGGYCG